MIDRSPRELALYEALTAASRATGAWEEVDAVIESLDAAAFEIVTSMEGFALAAMRQADKAPWWGWIRRRTWRTYARRAIQTANAPDFQAALAGAIRNRSDAVEQWFADDIVTEPMSASSFVKMDDPYKAKP